MQLIFLLFKEDRKFYEWSFKYICSVNLRSPKLNHLNKRVYFPPPNLGILSSKIQPSLKIHAFNPLTSCIKMTTLLATKEYQ